MSILTLKKYFITTILLISIACLCLVFCFFIGRSLLYQAVSGPRDYTTLQVVTESDSKGIAEWLGIRVPVAAKDLYYVDDGGIDPYIYMCFDLNKGDLAKFVESNKLVLDEQKHNAGDAFYTNSVNISKRYNWWSLDESVEGKVYRQENQKFAYLSILVIEKESGSVRIFIESWDT